MSVSSTGLDKMLVRVKVRGVSSTGLDKMLVRVKVRGVSSTGLEKMPRPLRIGWSEEPGKRRLVERPAPLGSVP